MIDPKKIRIDELPKKLVDGALGAHNKEVFMFTLMSGNQLDSFAATPRTMKSIYEWMKGQVESYEQKHGVIEISRGLTSPIQPSDLSKDE